MMNHISDIKHAFYINLNCRPDRKAHVEIQMKQIGINAQRFSAIQMKNGAIGCTMSHIKLLEMAKKNKWSHILIVEDDIHFTNPTLFVNQFNRFLSNQHPVDVLLIAGNNIPPYKQVSDYCVQVTKCQTTTGYLVFDHYYDTLIQNYKEGLLQLMKQPAKHFYFAIDKYWFQLQEKDKWYLIVPLTVTQMEDYSNIANKYTNYSSMMLDLNKQHLFRRA
jgi:glycosyl transferase family 25